MTERLYYEDATILEFDAEVMAVERQGDRYMVALDRTAFYPTSGGQQHDLGDLNGVAVVDVVEVNDGSIAHVTEQPVGEPGAKVQGRVDARRRRQHCRQHTAQHILSQAFVRLFGYETVSVHLGEEYGAVELDTGRLDDEEFLKAEEMSNKIVRENRPVTARLVGRDEAAALPLRKVPLDKETIRVVAIEDLDWSACGGTHCRRTSEVGVIKLVGREKMRGHVLVKFLCGDQALRDYQERYQVTDELSRLLTCNVTDLPEKVSGMDTQARDLRRKLAQAWRDLLPIRADAEATRIASQPNSGVCVIEEDVPDLKLAGELVGEVADRVRQVVLMAHSGRLLLATPAESTLHAGDLARHLAEQTGLRGGGSPRLAQLGGLEKEKLPEYRDIVRRFLDDE